MQHKRIKIKNMDKKDISDNDLYILNNLQLVKLQLLDPVITASVTHNKAISKSEQVNNFDTT